MRRFRFGASVGISACFTRTGCGGVSIDRAGHIVIRICAGGFIARDAWHCMGSEFARLRWTALPAAP